MAVAERGPRKRKSSKMKRSKTKNKARMLPVSGEKVKINQKMRKLFRKRAREYNSDDEDESAPKIGDHISVFEENQIAGGGDSFESDGEDGQDVDTENKEFSDDNESGEIQPGIANFAEGSRAFKMAFKSVLKNTISNDVLVSWLI